MNNGHLSKKNGQRFAADLSAEVTILVERLADQGRVVANGAEVQITSLDTPLSTCNALSASIKETSNQAESLSTSSDQMVSGLAELSASIEQVSVNVTENTAGITQTSTSI